MSTRSEMVALLDLALVRVGVSQAELCRQAGVSQKHLSLVLNGKSGASLELMDTLAEILDRKWIVSLKRRGR